MGTEEEMLATNTLGSEIQGLSSNRVTLGGQKNRLLVLPVIKELSGETTKTADNPKMPYTWALEVTCFPSLCVSVCVHFGISVSRFNSGRRSLIEPNLKIGSKDPTAPSLPLWAGQYSL